MSRYRVRAVRRLITGNRSSGVHVLTEPENDLKCHPLTKDLNELNTVVLTPQVSSLPCNDLLTPKCCPESFSPIVTHTQKKK